jgi:3-hydroxyisobutyrate dehydrogenase-like beta-hydroxyacid dehydrogenase
MAAVQTVGWIGSGKMGAPIGARLKDAGSRVTALCRNAEAEARATMHGFEVARTLASHQQIYVDMSTVSPEASARVANALATPQCAYLKAPVSRGPRRAELFRANGGEGASSLKGSAGHLNFVPQDLKAAF